MPIKNPLTSAGIEATASRFVAQHLKRCATAVPLILLHRKLFQTQIVDLNGIAIVYRVSVFCLVNHFKVKIGLN